MKMHLKVHLMHSERVATSDVCVTEAFAVIRSHILYLLFSRDSDLYLYLESFVIFQENYVC